MSKKYIALRKARRSDGEEKRLQIIATTSLERLTKEVGKYTTQSNIGGKALEISDERGVLRMLDELSIKSDKSLLMKEIRAQFESRDEYVKEWAPYGYKEELDQGSEHCGFLNFPIRAENFVKGLLYGYFNVEKTVALPTESIPSK
jgi:tRNA nucleotidyltransferase/poly(A) polymerase